MSLCTLACQLCDCKYLLVGLLLAKVHLQVSKSLPTSLILDSMTQVPPSIYCKSKGYFFTSVGWKSPFWSLRKITAHLSSASCVIWGIIHVCNTNSAWQITSWSFFRTRAWAIFNLMFAILKKCCSVFVWNRPQL